MTLTPEKKREIEAFVAVYAGGSRTLNGQAVGYIRDLLAELPEWRPIETAPHDKTLVDLWKDGRRHADCFFEDGEWRHIDRWTEGPKGHWARRFHVIDSPTHWQPLPSPPSESLET